MKILRLTSIVSLVLTSIMLGGCRDLVKREPLAPELTRQEMKEITTPITPLPLMNSTQNVKTKFDTIPPAFQQTVSVNISETAPLKPVLIELARQLNIDLQLDPKIETKIVFSCQNTPFIQVIDSLCDLAGLRYKIIHNSLRIEADSFYIENYNVQFLNLARNSTNRISIATDVFSDTANSSGKNSQDNGSNSAITVTGNNDFWTELENNLKIILSSTPHTTAGAYSLHRQGGIVSISGTSKHHQLIKNYLKALRLASSSQVLIEAKIIEVILKDEFRSGINWQKLNNRGDLRFNAPFGDFANRSRFLDPSSLQNGVVSFGAAGKTFSMIIEALQEFGSSRTLSSPRLTVMNNQTAILKVAQNQVYFRLRYDKQYNTAVQRESVTVSSDIQTVPIGFVMSVQPSIDLETGEIILFLRPTISRLNQSVRDPAVDIIKNSLIAENGSSPSSSSSPSLIPVVEVREIDSILRVKDGGVAILGGLMEVRSIEDTNKIPIIGDIELVRELFSSQTSGDQVVELVILLKATIMSEGSTGIHLADSRLGQYIPDPRPLIP